MKAATVLRKMISSDDLVLAPGAYDALTAKIIEREGFPAVYMTGAGTATGNLGLADGLQSMTEMVLNANRICSAVTIPVIADADTGYGNPMNVMRTVKEYEKAGAAGIHIEDQTWPKRCGHIEGKSLISAAEMVKKIRASLDARDNPDFVIIARTDALAVEGVNKALERAEKYAEAGADMIFVETGDDIDEIKKIATFKVKPLLFNHSASGKVPYLPLSELKDLGFKLIIFPMHAIHVVCYAFGEFLRSLKATDNVIQYLDRMVSFDEWQEIVDYQQMLKLSMKYATND